ncbi:MAG: type II toxin-antitoxin system RelE/ParE family toxin [Bifidobacteriaceae bacterium]|nr:type II toxin-antitoxin system RelE/ParE family toxin [Bifidobacteriaceae bacterium]
MTDNRYAITWTSAATRHLRKLPKHAQQRIVAIVELLSNAPRPAKAIKLTDEQDLWRIRTGDYRIVYHIEDKMLVIVVVKVAHRRDVYRHS